MFNNVYRNRRVLITGHTGFKGSWLALWLSSLGADVIGYSLPAPTSPSHFENLDLSIASITGDVLDRAHLESTILAYNPEIVFHLAAQALVRVSYQNPSETLQTNIQGTVNLLEACRRNNSVRAIVNVTSDKCYEDRDWPWGYRENDRLAGRDPYSASKACAEIVTASWRDSFYSIQQYGKSHKTLLASVRAGNVIGGGDWAIDRLLPDMVRAASQNQTLFIRNPNAIRAWQHVLEPLSGYLLIGQKLLEGETRYAEAWNFGPGDKSHITVQTLADYAKEVWPGIRYELKTDDGQPHETRTLRLDCSKALTLLNWAPVWDLRTTVNRTIRWYKDFYQNRKVRSTEDLDCFLGDARSKGIPWTG